MLLFVDWGSLWEGQAVDLPRLLGKDLRIMLPTLLLETEPRKRDSYSPQSLCFNSPHPSSISQKCSLPLTYLSFQCYNKCLLPNLGGISHPYPKDRDCTTWVLVLHTQMSKLDSLLSRLRPELSWSWLSFPKDQQDNPRDNRKISATYGFCLALLYSTCNSLAERSCSPFLPHLRSQASTFPFLAGP